MVPPSLTSPITPIRSPSSVSPFPSPAQPNIPPHGLLIPTDRTLDELETKWLKRLGRLRVEREVVLRGYALYSLRSWFLSRTHFSHTIVTQTGKPNEHISAYLLVPIPELSEREGLLEINKAIQILAAESKSQPRKTELGTLLVTTPSAFGQDINPVLGGDFRVAKPYIIVNTGLRRSGCGGRAILGLEPPIPALRRKFHDLYRIPVPAHASSTFSRQNSPTTSPTTSMPYSPSPPNSSTSPRSAARNKPVQAHEDIHSDPFTFIVVELVKLIQAALALWGMFEDLDEDADGPGMEIDGLFCDETKAAIFRWRKVMGMEHEESLKLEKETSGGCIDPKTLAALLSSVTSVHYQLDALDVERLPKDPFTNIRRTLKSWLFYQQVYKHRHPTPFFTVPSIRALVQSYLSDRRHVGDSLRVQRLFHGVAHTASNLSANLKGGNEDTSLRRREHHNHHFDPVHLEEEGSGVDMILPEGEVSPIAPPDVMTSDLEAYIKGVVKSREKDWDVMGARRVAELWNGTLAESVEGRRRRRGTLTNLGNLGMGPAGIKGNGEKARERGVLRKRTMSKDDAMREEDEGDLKGTIKEFGERAGLALRGGLGRMSRKNTAYETSDSENGAGPGPSTLRAALLRKKPGTVPIVVEPHPDGDNRQSEFSFPSSSHSPSPRHLTPNIITPIQSFTTKPSFLSPASRVPSRADSARPPTISIPSGNESDVWSRNSARGETQADERSEYDWPHPQKRISWMNSSAAGPSTGGAVSASVGRSDKASARRLRAWAPAMVRASSDGADVMLDHSGMEWEIRNPRGTGKRGQEDDIVEVVRRHSFSDLDDHRGARLLAPEYLQIDAEMCAAVLELRERERQLTEKVLDVKLLEQAVYDAGQALAQDCRVRRNRVANLETQADTLRASLEALATVETYEEELSYDRFHYYLSEETHRPELLDDLGRLKEMWEEVRKEGAEMRQSVDRKEVKRGWWFW